jgi:predicted nucleotidyltransferase
MLTKLVNATGCEMVIELVFRGSHSESVPVERPLRQRVRDQREAILTIAARRGARNVRLFGSVARGDESSMSDVDFLVELDDGVSLIELIGLERELSELLGCAVDLVPERNVKAGISDRVLIEATPL